jgi:Tol biopolymer transport system component
MNLDGSGREQITHNQEQEFLPHFSPDGTRLLYTRYRSDGYGIPGSQSMITVYDFATNSTRDLTSTGKDHYPVWSPDGARIAFLSTRDYTLGGGALWVMNADGTNAHEIARPSGSNLDHGWGDIAWSSEDWILFVVAENNATNTCFKTRLDKVRPDGTQRTQVTDGGPNCTPAGMEQNGDADPGFSADGAMIYSSRGFPTQPPGITGGTVRRLYAMSSEAWFPGKPEYDLSLASAPDCIEGVPKGSPDGTRILLFRACAGEQAGITVTDTAGSYRTWIADGFGPDWNPAWRP